MVGGGHPLPSPPTHTLQFMTDQDVIGQTAAAVAEGKQLRPIVDELINTSNNLWLKEEEVIDDTTVCIAWLTGYPPTAEGGAASS